MKKIMCFFLLASMTMAILPVQSHAAVIVPVKSEPDPAAVKAAVAEFKNLSRKERKERIKETKKQLKYFKQEKKAGRGAKVEQVVLIILAILLPPLSVYLHQGETNNKFWLNVILTLLFWLPGVIHALIVVLGD